MQAGDDEISQETQNDMFDRQLPVYQTSIAVNLAIAITSIFVVFSGPRVGC
jgi:hypothetical protein